MINWKTLVIGTVALVAIPLSTYATQSHQEVNNQELNNMRRFAQRIKHGKRDGGHRMDKVLQQLDLTPEQSEQIEAIKEQSKTRMEDLKQQMRSQREQMKSLLANDADAEEIRTQHQEAQDLHQQAANNRFETMLEIREVLTSEQRAKIAELMEQHRGGKGRDSNDK